MTGEIGQLALCLAFALSLVQAVSGIVGGARNTPQLMAMSRGAALGVFVFIGLSFAALTYAYVTSDFSVLAVAENSSLVKPLLYKFTGVWGNHEGSMLLWLLILSVYSAAIAMTVSGGERLAARALGVQALIAIAFLIFVLFTSDPFVRVSPPPFQGNGLNPLLQDPGLAFHPPLLYLGYVGLSATFSYAAAALLSKRNDAAWVRAAKPFVLTSWTALTLGIAAGSWWAYYTLGWGGFWFWDPVENASLMPWLIATALIHSMLATEKSGAFKSWTLLLAIAAFSFSLIGTFLVRSGVLNSVHSFANDPQRGVFILGIIAVAIGIPLTLFAWRAPSLAPGAPFDWVSRESGLLVNNLLLTLAASTILLGTLYPLLLDALEGVKISVAAPFFNMIVLPMFALLAVFVPFGPLLGWRRSDLGRAAYQLRFAMAAALFGVALAWVLSLAFNKPGSLAGMIAIGFGLWLIVGALTDLYRRAGHWRYLRYLSMGAVAVALAHAGLGVTVLGVAGTSVWKSQNIQVLAPGQSMTVGGYKLTLEGSKHVPGPNFMADRADILVSANGHPLTTVHPEKRSFPEQQMVTTDSAIRTTGIADLYVVLGDPRDNGAWVVRAYVNPLAPLIWLGGVLMALGGMLAVVLRVRRALSARARVPAGASGAVP